jgi:tetrahydrodipicolinate N-succinyltransferase
MFTLKWTDIAQRTYDELKTAASELLKLRTGKGKKKSSKQEGLFKQVHKTISLLRTNPRHPGLNTHEYDSIQNPYDKNQKVFEAYAQNKSPGAFRVFWCYGPGNKEITIIAITPHS